MKKRILSGILAAISLVVLSVSVLQLSTRVVNASGCPQQPFLGCDCALNWYTTTQYGEETHYLCNYSCFCPGQGGGAENFYIERDYSFVQ